MCKRAFFAWLALAFLLVAPGALAADSVLIEEKATVFSPEAMKDWKITFHSLDDWVTRVSRKEWRVLYKKETKDFYVALFLEPDQRLVVASWRLDGVEEFSWGVGIYDEKKDIAYNTRDGAPVWLNVRLTTVPVLDENGTRRSLGCDKKWCVGDTFSIRKDYKGKLHIEKDDQVKNDPKSRMVLDYTLEWPVPK